MDHNFSVISQDETTIRSLTGIISSIPGFKCITISKSYDNGLNEFLKNFPSLVFLDLEMNERDGNPFYFVNQFYQYVDHFPVFIALSSSKELAYEVIKNNFFDYLLKPLSEFELRKCLMKFQTQRNSRQLEKICIKSYSDYQFLNLKEISFLKADNNTTDFFLESGKKISAFKTLKYFEDLLPENFVRVHNSFIVNTEKINRISFGKNRIILKEGSQYIPFSKSYKSEVESLKEKIFTSLSVVS